MAIAGGNGRRELVFNGGTAPIGEDDKEKKIRSRVCLDRKL